MVKNIVIINESEIVQRGISSIVRKNFNININCLNDIKELNRYKKLADNFFLLLIPENSYSLEDIKGGFDESNIIDVIWLSRKIRNNSSEEENLLCLDDSEEEIVKIISSALKENNIPEDKVVNVTELSEREIDVLKLVAKGFSNKDIGEKLFISIHTVISHRKNITKKLGIKSISGLTVYAILNKLIEP